MRSTRAPVNAPPMFYPRPSTTEARRRGSPPILFMLGVVVFLLALVFGISFAREGSVALGGAIVLLGAVVLGLLFRGFNRASV